MRDASCWATPLEFTIAGVASSVSRDLRRTGDTMAVDYFDPEKAARGRANSKQVRAERRARINA